MTRFRITYHTAGGSFVRDVEAADAAQAEAEALMSLEAGETLRYVAGDLVILLRTAQVAALSLEPFPAETSGRSAGLLRH